MSAFSIVMVIYIHMYYTEGSTMPILNLVEKTVSSFCRTAVPLFYIISGYLFFLKVPDGIKSITGKMRKRGRTLLVPYLIANVFTFFFYCGVNAVALKFGGVADVVNFKIFNDMAVLGVWGTLELVFINPPIAFQLWFVRDLMVMVLLSPLIWLMLKGLVGLEHSVGKFLPIMFLAVLFAAGMWIGYAATAFWFMSGGYIAMSRVNIGCSIRNRIALFAVCAGFLVCLAVCVTESNDDLMGKCLPLFGVPALWLLYDAMSDHLSSARIDWFAKYTFFVYLVHEPFLNIFKKMPLLISRSELMFIISYLTIPILFYVVACVVGERFSRWFPNAYKIYTGGR